MEDPLVVREMCSRIQSEDAGPVDAAHSLPPLRLASGHVLSAALGIRVRAVSDLNDISDTQKTIAVMVRNRFSPMNVRRGGVAAALWASWHYFVMPVLICAASFVITRYGTDHLGNYYFPIILALLTGLGVLLFRRMGDRPIDFKTDAEGNIDGITLPWLCQALDWHVALRTSLLVLAATFGIHVAGVYAEDAGKTGFENVMLESVDVFIGVVSGGISEFLGLHASVKGPEPTPLLRLVFGVSAFNYLLVVLAPSLPIWRRYKLQPVLRSIATGGHGSNASALLGIICTHSANLGKAMHDEVVFLAIAGAYISGDFAAVETLGRTFSAIQVTGRVWDLFIEPSTRRPLMPMSTKSP